MRSDWFLVVGYGSAGRRHFQNLRSLGVTDARLLRAGPPRPGAFETPTGARVYRDLDSALADCPGVVIVANPTSLHCDTACEALRVGASVLLEKPVGDSLKAARSLLACTEESGRVCGMAYCFRYHPLYQALRKAVHAGEIGRVFHAHTWQASYLPGWHPWEDYRTGYAARADLGGGVLRTLDHDLDLLRWVLGQPRAVLASAGTLSGIGVEVEDTADMIFRFSGPLQANSHVCFGRQDLCRGFWAIGEEGSATVDWGRGTLTINRGKDIARVVSLPPGYDLNQAYLEMLRDAVGGFAEDPPRAAVPLADGVAALEMALGALESSSSGRLIPLKGA